MTKLQKNKKTQIWKALTRFAVLVLAIFSSVFFIACSTNEKEAESGYDAYGKYRLEKPDIIYYEKTKDNGYNEDTGSFLVPLEFYNNNSTTNSLSYDQSGENAYYNFVNTWIADSKKDLDLTAESIQYPDLTFMVDGYVYQLHISVDTTNLKIHIDSDINIGLGKMQLHSKSKSYVYPTAAMNQVFKLSYRLGTSGTWIDASGIAEVVALNAGDITRDYVESGEISSGVIITNGWESSDGRFYLLFKPQLHDGMVSRKIKVKTTPNINMSDDLIGTDTSINRSTNPPSRGDSIYSQTISYNAYKMTFKTNDTTALNTASYDFGQIEYNKNKYFFFDEKYTVSTTANKEYLTSVTGYFPAGRIINITRTFDNEKGGKDYAFQSWTVNKKSTATTALENTFYLPGSTTTDRYGINRSSSYYSSIKNAFVNYNLIENYDLGYTCIFGDKLANNQFYVKSLTASFPEIKIDTKIKAYEALNVSNQENRYGTISAVSCEEHSTAIFYANFVKTNNFVISGSVLNADNILVNNNVELTDYYNTKFNFNGTSISQVGTPYLNSTSKFSFDKIQLGEYFVLSKEVDGSNGDEYYFYGTYMTTPYLECVKRMDASHAEIVNNYNNPKNR